MIPLILPDFLYGLEWDEKIDTMFAEVISDQALLGNFSNNGGDNSVAIKTAQYVVNKSFGKSFDYKKFNRQLCKLKKRHQVFSWILSLDGFSYDEVSKHTHASTELWRSIVEIEPFAHAYAVHGDPCWELLKNMFGPPPVVAPQPIPISIRQEIINIPSDEEDGKEIIHVDSSSNATHGTSYWNCVAGYNDGSDSENSPSIKTEASTSNANNVMFGSPPRSFHTIASDWSPWKKE